jgi:hypothetical protein
MADISAVVVLAVAEPQRALLVSPASATMTLCGPANAACSQKRHPVAESQSWISSTL